MNRVGNMMGIACVLSLALCSCSGGRGQRLSAEERAVMLDCAYCSYDDMISFIVEGYQMHWSFETRPDEYGMSSIYCYESPCAGFVKKDIDGNGIEDLILGENGPDGPTVIYDIMTIDPETFDRVNVVSGGERDRFHIVGNIIVEEGSNSAFDSFRRVYRFEDGRLERVECTVDEASYERLDLDCFIRYASIGK